MTSSHDPACWIYVGKIILMKVYIFPTHPNIATIMHVTDTVSRKVYVDLTFPIFTQIQTISTKIYWFKLIKAKKSPFPPKSMLKNLYIWPTSTETRSVRSMQTCPSICIILNIDLGGGRGGKKGVCQFYQYFWCGLSGPCSTHLFDVLRKFRHQISILVAEM